MENINNLEQPEIQSEITHNVNEQIINEEEVKDESTLNEGSTFGKFKDATSLLNAYNNLEKEFTKKSQKLSELTKSLNNEKTQIIEENPSNSSYIYKNKDWRSNITKFFDKNPEAKNYSKEIAELLLNDEHLAQNSNGLEYAYAIVSKEHYIKPAQLLNDPKHLEDIYNNETIKNNIIKQYLKGINENKNNIRLISGEPKSISPTRPIDKPKTLKEASNILKKLLEK